MDNGSLKHETGARQHHSSKSESFSQILSDKDAFCDTLQAMHFSLTFTASEWRLFWRLLNVGCMLADELLDLHENPQHSTTGDSALLWNTLSTELADRLKYDVIQVKREKVEITA